jgi:hypothetical protein
MNLGTSLFTIATAVCLSNFATANETNPALTPLNAATSELELSTERVIVFKDGYAMVVKKGIARTDKDGLVYSDDVPNSAILGSFWAIPSKGTIKSMVAGWVDTETESEREINCTNVVEIIKANIGKTCKLTLPGEEEAVLEGKLIKLLSNDDVSETTNQMSREARIRASLSSTRPGPIQPVISVNSVSGTHFIFRTQDGDMMLAANSIRNLTIDGMESTRKQTTTTKTRHKRLSWSFKKPNSEVEISLMYFRPDVRWIPTYRVNLTQDAFVHKSKKVKQNQQRAAAKTAEIFLQGELLNEAEDFTDVPFHVVVGVPNFRFRSVPSPMILESNLRNLLAQAAPNIMGGQSQLSNALYTQRGSEFRSDRSQGTSESASVDLPEELSSSAGNDLFVYKLDKMTLRKGERACVPIMRTKVAYRDIYTWDIQVTHSETFAATSSGTVSPLVLTENKVWRQIELINDTEIPWTTGAAMFVDGFQPLAQELLTYTSPGGICRVPVTVAVDLRGKVVDQEVKRELKAVKWRNREYARVHGKTEIELANNKNESVPVEVKVRFGGKPNKISDEGTKIVEAFRPDDWLNRQGDSINNSSVVSWKSSIKPGECFKPTFDYEFLLRY